MENRRLETDGDIKEIHDRIDMVLDKMEASNQRIMDEFKSLRSDMQDHNQNEKEALDKLLQWKWMVAGGIIVVSWLISNVNINTIVNSIK
jgi:Flp pilus assembly protein TadB